MPGGQIWQANIPSLDDNCKDHHNFPLLIPDGQLIPQRSIKVSAEDHLNSSVQLIG